MDIENKMIQVEKLECYLKYIQLQSQLNQPLRFYVQKMNKIDLDDQQDNFQLILNRSQICISNTIMKVQQSAQSFKLKNIQTNYRSLTQPKDINTKTKIIKLKFIQALVHRMECLNEEEIELIIHQIQNIVKDQLKMTKFKDIFLDIFSKLSKYSTYRLLFYLAFLCSFCQTVFSFRIIDIQQLFIMIIQCQFSFNSSTKLQDFIHYLAKFYTNSQIECLNNISYLAATLKILSKKAESNFQLATNEVILLENLIKKGNFFRKSFNIKTKDIFIHESLFLCIYNFICQGKYALKIADKVLLNLIKCRFNLNIAKIMIRKLQQKDRREESSNKLEEQNLNEWVTMFKIHEYILRLYPKNYQYVKFKDPIASISRKIRTHENVGANFIPKPFVVILSLKTILKQQQYVIATLICQKMKSQYWILIQQHQNFNEEGSRVYQGCTLSISEVNNGNQIRKQKSQIYPWNHLWRNTLYIQVSTIISLRVNQQSQSLIQMELKNNQVMFDGVIVGGGQFSTSIQQLYSFQYFNGDYNKLKSAKGEIAQGEKCKLGLVNLLLYKQIPNLNIQSLSKTKGFKKQQLDEQQLVILNHQYTTLASQSSYIKVIQSLGNLDLFFLIMSHIIRKKNGNSSQLIVKKIKVVMKFFGEYVLIKGVDKKKMSIKQSEQRVSKVLSLCFLVSRQIFQGGVDIIKVLTNLICIRDVMDEIQICGLLDIYCNFGFWREMALDQQLSIVDQISKLFNKLLQIFNNTLESSTRNNICLKLIKYWKNIIMQILLFYSKNIQQKCVKTEEEIIIDQNKLEYLRAELLGTISRTLVGVMKYCFTFRQKNDQSLIKLRESLQSITQFFKWLVIIQIHIINQGSQNGYKLAIILSLILKNTAKFLYKKYLQLKNCIHIQQAIFLENQVDKNKSKQSNQQNSLFLSEDINSIAQLVWYILEKPPEQFSLNINNKIYVLDPQPQCRYFQSRQILDNMASFIIYFQSLNLSNYKNIIYRISIRQYTDQLYNSILNIHLLPLLKYYQQNCCIQLENQYLNLIDVILSNDFSDFKINKQVMKTLITYSLQKSNQISFSILNNISNHILKSNQYLCQISKLYYSIINSQQQKNTLESIQIKIHIIFLNNNSVNFDNVTIILNLLKNNNYRHYQMIETLFHIRKLINLSQYNQIRLSQKVKKVTQNIINIEDSIVMQFCKCIKQEVKMHKQNLTINLKNIQEKLEKIQNEINEQQYNKFELKSTILSKFHDFLNVQVLNLVRFSSFYKIKRSINNYKTLTPKQYCLKRSNRKGSAQCSQFNEAIFKKSVNIISDFIYQQRSQTLSIETIWEEARKKNKYFWRIFFSNEDTYQLDEFATDLKNPLFIRKQTKKNEFLLPKMKCEKLQHKASIIQQKQQQVSQAGSGSQPSIYQHISTIYKQSDLEATEASTNHVEVIVNKNQKLKKWNKFKVFLIKVDKIYYGTLSVEIKERIVQFKQLKCQDQKYKAICANQSEKRTIQEIYRTANNFWIIMDRRCRIMRKKYLFQQGALQIYDGTFNKTYFFFFDGYAKKRRQEFIQIFSQSTIKNDSFISTVENKLKPEELLQSYQQQWVQGNITNFQYLMRVNDCAGRSFNDLSQYYIFPWTICQFKQQVLNLENANNYRDLSKPMGAVNQQRWGYILQRYKNNLSMQKNYGQKHKKNKINKMDIIMEPFLYGSFYSNPAIVSNFLLRFNPFTLYHCKLQSKKFDQADRLFFSIEEQFISSTNNLSDLKELIPQFYSFPQFLRNRCKYNLGTKQNKVKIDDKMIGEVDDVILPKWVRVNTNTAQQFIFKMRQALQSVYVTKNIHHWIDLIFGVRNNKQKGLQNKNLFSSTVYEIDIYNIDPPDQREQILLFYKQFGQNPRAIFTQSHPQYKGIINKIGEFQKSITDLIFTSKEKSSTQVCNTKLLLIQDQQYLSYFNKRQEIIIKNDCAYFLWKQRWIASIKYEFISSKNKLKDFLKISKNPTKKDKAQCQMIQLCKPSVIKDKKINNLSNLSNFTQKQPKIQFLVLFSMKNNEDNFVECFFYLKNQKVYLRQFKNSNQFLEQKLFSDKHNYRIMKSIKEYIFMVENTQIHFYCQKNYTNYKKKNQNANNGTQYKQKLVITTKSGQFEFFLHSIFSQHDFPIVCAQVSQQLCVLVTIDMSNRVFVLNLSGQIYIRYSFMVKELFIGEIIRKVIIHDMGLILIFTQMSRIIIYNLMGDLILKSYIQIVNQKVTDICFFSHQKSDIVIATNIGKIYKINLFKLNKEKTILNGQKSNQKFEILTICQSSIIKLKCQSIGRHWQIIVQNQDGNIYTVKSQRFGFFKIQK